MEAVLAVIAIAIAVTLVTYFSNQESRKLRQIVKRLGVCCWIEVNHYASVDSAHHIQNLSEKMLQYEQSLLATVKDIGMRPLNHGPGTASAWLWVNIFYLEGTETPIQVEWKLKHVTPSRSTLLALDSFEVLMHHQNYFDQLRMIRSILLKAESQLALASN